jgi:hypothetical protein
MSGSRELTPSRRARGVCSRGPGRLDVFVKGTNNALWHTTYDGEWSDVEQFAPNAIASEPVAVSRANGRIDLFVRGTVSAMMPTVCAAPGVM